MFGTSMRALWFAMRVHTIALIVLTALVVVGYLKVVDASNRATGLAHAIQQQRLDLLRSNCVDVNIRHDATITTLNGLIAVLHGRKQAQARASERATISLINALDPKRDCAALVRAARLPH